MAMDKKRKLRIRTDALVLLLATIGVAIVLNAMVLKVPARLDLTAYKVHTLSDASIEAAKSLDNVTINVYISKKLPETIPSQFGKIPLKGVDRAFRDKLDEYATASGGKIRVVFADLDTPNLGTIEEQAEAARLEMFSSKEAAVEGGQLKFQQYAMGASFHYKSVTEVLPKAIEPGFYEFEITKRLLRLKEKYDNSLLMKDLLDSGKKVHTVVKACNEAIQKHAKAEDKKEDSAGFNIKDSKDPNKKRMADLKANRKSIEAACSPIGGAVTNAEGKLKGKNDFVDNLLASAKQYGKVYGEMLRYLDGKSPKKSPVPPEMALAQIVNILEQINREVDLRHTTLTDSPGQRRIGFLCGHQEFCPFQEREPLIAGQVGMMVENNPMMRQVIETARQMATAIDQTNQRVGDGLFTKKGFSIIKLAPNMEFPPDVAAVIVYAPRSDIGEYDAYNLDQFLISGRPVAVFHQGYEVAINNMKPGKEMGQELSFGTWIKPNKSNIGKLLADYGVEVSNQLIVDRKHVDTVRVMQLLNRGGMQFQTQRDFAYPLVPVATEFSREHALTRSIQNLSLPFPVKVGVKDSVRKDTNFKVYDLIKTSEDSLLKDGSVPANPLALSEAVVNDPANGPHVAAVMVEGPFKSRFTADKVPKRPPPKKKANPFGRGMPDGPKAETKDEYELRKRRFKATGAGKLLVVGTHMGIEGLSRDYVLPDFNGIKMAKFSVESLQAYQRWQANFQNWQIRIGQVSHLLPDNLRFLNNVMDWATAHEALADIRSKGDTRRPLREVKADDARTMRLGAIVGVPLLLIGFGFIRLTMRRRRENELDNH